MDERYIAAVDLGSSKMALTVAKIENEDVQVIYYREVPSDGIRYSYVFNPQRVAKPLADIIHGAETELGIKILQVVVGLPRYYVRQEKAKGEIPRSDTGSCITREEVENLKNMALDNYPLSEPDKEIIYGAVAQSFSTDEYFQIVESDVEGMVSDRLEGDFRVFIGSKKNVSNIDKVFNDLGVAIARKYFVPDAQAKIVLTNEEIDNGVALIDLGGGVTSVSVYQSGIMRHYASIPFGGSTVTNDIKLECGFSPALAENIKLAYGACMPEKLASMSEKVIKVSYADSGAEKELPVRYLSETITCRTREIVEAMLYEIQRSGFADELRNGIVITGGGAGLTNISNLIKEMSGYNVRVGYPLHKFSATGCKGVGETGATSVIGMVIAAKEDRFLNCLEEPPKPVSENPQEAQQEEEQEYDRPDDALFAADEFGEKVKPVKPARTQKPQKPSRPPKEHNSGIWKVFRKVEDTVTLFYNDMENDE